MLISVLGAKEGDKTLQKVTKAIQGERPCFLAEVTSFTIRKQADVGGVHRMGTPQPHG